MPMASDFSDSDEDQDLSQWSQIDDRFRGLLLDTDSSAIFDFLETFLKFVRNGPKESRKFTRFIFKYLLATTNLISNGIVDQSYYIHIKDILVIYCVLESRLITCFDDESAVASRLIMRISLLMQGSVSVTIVDVLVDIDEIIRSPRSKSLMAIVYKYFLTTKRTGQQRVLDDNSYIKHLILYRSVYTSTEVMSEKLNVYKSFTSTIKPTEELRNNPSYSLLGIDEEIDYRKLLAQPLPRNALITALREAGSNGDCKNDDANPVPLDELLDVTTNDKPVIKVEVDLSLNLPNETIIVDDEDDDIDDGATISYLPNLFERMNVIEECGWRVAVLQHSQRLESAKGSTPARKRVTFGGVTTRIFERYDVDDSFSHEKKVTFGGVTTHIFERYDFEDSYSDDSYDYDSHGDDSHGDDSSDSNDVSNTGFCSSTVCIPVAESFNRNTFRPPSSFPDMMSNVDGTNDSSSTIDDEVDRSRCSTLAKSKSRKKKRSHFGLARSRTSIADWEKRKKLVKLTQFASSAGVKTISCSVRLTRLPDEARTSQNSAVRRRIDRFDKDDTINTERWHSESSTTNRCMLSTSTFSETLVKKTTAAHTKNKAAKSVVPLTGKRRESFRGNCSVLLKRLPDVQPQVNSSKKTRKRESLETITSPRCSSTESTSDVQLECSFNETSTFDSSSTSKLTSKNSSDEQILTSSQPVLEYTNIAQTMSTNQISEWNSMDLDQIEHIICCPDTTTVAYHLSEENTEPRLNNDEDSLCARISDVNAKRSLPVEFVDCENDIPSPMYSPLKGKRQKNNGDRFVPMTAVSPGIVADGSKNLDDISEIGNCIVPISQPV